MASPARTGPRRASTGRVAEARVGALAFCVHAAEHRDGLVDVIDDADLVLGVVVSVQPTGVLRRRALPSDRHREYERVQARVVEPLTDIPARREHYARPVAGEHVAGAASRLDAHAAVQNDDAVGLSLEELGDRVEVFAALGE